MLGQPRLDLLPEFFQSGILQLLNLFFTQRTDQFTEGPAIQVLQEKTRGITGVHKIIEATDGSVVQAGQDSRLPTETIPNIIRNSQSRAENLDRHLAIEALIHPEIDLTHPTGADELNNSDVADVLTYQGSLATLSS